MRFQALVASWPRSRAAGVISLSKQQACGLWPRLQHGRDVEDGNDDGLNSILADVADTESLEGFGAVCKVDTHVA